VRQVSGKLKNISNCKPESSFAKSVQTSKGSSSTLRRPSPRHHTHQPTQHGCHAGQRSRRPTERVEGEGETCFAHWYNSWPTSDPDHIQRALHRQVERADPHPERRVAPDRLGHEDQLPGPHQRHTGQRRHQRQCKILHTCRYVVLSNANLRHCLVEPDGDDHVRAVQQRRHGHLGRPDHFRVVPCPEPSGNQSWDCQVVWFKGDGVVTRRKHLAVAYNV